MKNNKILILIGISVLLILVLAACSTQAEAVNGQTTGTEENQAFEMPLQTKLLVGTFKLEETDQAVNADQAVDLLPLWKAYKNLLNSETTSQLETDALLNQIQEMMTSNQLSEINSMDLSNGAYQEIVQKYLPEDMQNNPLLAGDEERQAMRETAVAQNGGETAGNRGGGIPGGGVPGGGTGGGTGPNAEMRQAIEGGDSNGFAGNRNKNPMTVYLIDALIQLLEAK